MSIKWLAKQEVVSVSKELFCIQHDNSCWFTFFFLTMSPFAMEQTEDRYMAPEVFKHRKYDKKVDVFSFAMILYEVSVHLFGLDIKDWSTWKFVFLIIFSMYRCLKEIHQCPIMSHMKLPNMWQKAIDLSSARKDTFKICESKLILDLLKPNFWCFPNIVWT